ncbi:phosphotransferase enzyme family protein [Ceratobasidium sp. AG-Ba]|nr:phosphotransferase enzyme family protein [Ceratobasidium sp. AG-Ba]
MAASAPALSFDFAPFLKSLDPCHTYTSTPLSGGLNNLTSRIVVSTSSEKHECKFGSAKSVVAKYAPPYIATIGEKAPFSQFRQIIEARALAFLTRAYSHPSVATPTLIHHDPSAHVMLMSDLGTSSLGVNQWLLSPNIRVEDAKSAGERFGSFFAHLGELNPGLFNLDFENPSARNLVLDVAVRAVHGDLLKCGIDPNVADDLTRSAIESFELQTKYEEELAFSLGDCWPPSLLVLDERGSGLAVIDWEFAGMNFPLQDIAQLTAHLYLLHQSSRSSYQAVIKAFALSLFQAHYASAAPRHYGLLQRTNAWKLLGREIVINAVEGEWFGEHEERKQSEVRRIGRVGAGLMKDAMEIARDGFVANAPPFESFFSQL